MPSKALGPHQPEDYRMEVVKDAVEKKDGIWYVTVLPTRDDVRSYDFNARLAEAAVDIMEKNNLYIQFTTVMPQLAD